ncbi:hypothetical protein JCM5353_007502 [Sporobolomyces roseus]
MDATSASVNAQGLTDRLVVAAEEQDVLYVLHWLGEMRLENCLEQAIDGKHSWKGYSALEFFTKSPLSQLRRIILELLLLAGAKNTTEQPFGSGLTQRNTEVLEIVMNWKKGGEDEAIDTKHLASLSLPEAANFIDLNLPLPPNPEALTGCQDPPTQLSTLALSSSSDTFSQSVKPKVDEHQSSSAVPSRGATPFEPSKQLKPLNEHIQAPREQLKSICNTPHPPSSVPTSNLTSVTPALTSNRSSPPSYNTFSYTPPSSDLSLQFSNTPSAPSSFSHPSSRSSRSPLKSALSNPPKLVQIHIDNLPRKFPTSKVQILFDEINVRCLVKFCRSKDQCSYAFLLVELDKATFCVQQLNGKIFGHRRLRCSIKAEKIGYENKESFVVFDRLPLSPQPDLLPLPSQSQSRLLVFNLPLNETNSAVYVISSLPNVQLFRLFQQNQSVAFARAGSTFAADLLVNLFNGSHVDGRKIEVVRVPNGLTPDQAIRLHLETLHSRTQVNSSSQHVDQSSSSSPSIDSTETVTRKRKSMFKEIEGRKSKWKEWRIHQDT